MSQKSYLITSSRAYFLFSACFCFSGLGLGVTASASASVVLPRPLPLSRSLPVPLKCLDYITDTSNSHKINVAWACGSTDMLRTHRQTQRHADHIGLLRSPTGRKVRCGTSYEECRQSAHLPSLGREPTWFGAWVYTGA